MTAQLPAAARLDPAEMETLRLNRMTNLLKRANEGKPLSKVDREDLRRYCGGRLPWEPEPEPAPVVESLPAEAPAPPPMKPRPQYKIRPPDPQVWRKRARDLLIARYSQWLEIREQPPSMQWARDHIVLPASISPQKPGAYDPDSYPMATVLYEFFDNPEYEEFIGVKSSQSGFTQAALNLLCEIIEYQLGNVMIVMDSAENVKAKCDEAIKPMIMEACKTIARHIPEDEDKLKKIVLHLKGIRVNLAGAKSAGKLASRTIPFVIGDEVDEWPTELQGGESNALDLLRDRCKLLAGTGRKKLMVFSKPRNALAPERAEERESRRHKKAKDDGIIWQEAMTGTRHRCFVPCPHCGQFDHLRWEHMRFNHCRTEDGTAWDYPRMLRDTYYECRLCKGEIRENDVKDSTPVKEWMIKRRQWRVTNLGQDDDKPVPGKMSALTDDLLATDPGSTWGHLAMECVNAKTTSQKRKFRRSRLGLPVQEKVLAKQKVNELAMLQGTYQRGTAPDSVIAACTMIDVQEHGNLFKWQHLGFDLEDNLYLINHGETEIGDELGSVIDMDIKLVDASGTETGRTIKAPIGWIDEGDGQCQHTILDLCVKPKFYRRLSTVKGRGLTQTEHMTDRVTLQNNRTHKAKPIDRYLVDNGYFLDDLYEARIAPWIEYFNDRAAGKSVDIPIGPRVHWYAKPDTTVLEEYTTERKDWHMRNGKMVFGWPEKPEGKNDHSDMSKYGLGWWYRAKPMILNVLKRKALLAAAAAAEAETATPKAKA